MGIEGEVVMGEDEIGECDEKRSAGKTVGRALVEEFLQG